nr:RNA-dependent RNA polymerase [Phomopsis vexans ourmia-like virus 1]
MLYTTDVRACGVAKRTANCLTLATEVLVRERLALQPFKPAAPLSCSSVQVAWKEWIRDNPVREGRRGDEAALAIKGCKTLFDEPCGLCDPPEQKKAKKAWFRNIKLEKQTSQDDLSDLTSWVRRRLNGWKYTASDSVYVPDQQGCAEMKGSEGGTFSVAFDEELDDVRHCRLAVAKTKGNFRVVTMQGSKSKRLFRPIHNSLYGYLTKRGLAHRGEVTSADFSWVAEKRRKGDYFISGDYTSATDHLHSDAVRAVVSVIAEHLPPVLGEELVRSFSPFVYDSGGKKCRIRRGAMMGNLVSFPILCLINRYCVERALRSCRRSTRCKINGDDCFFSGNEEVYCTWKVTTGRFGLIVNDLKTGMSLTSGELNSQQWVEGKLRRKLCFGFLSKFAWRSVHVLMQLDPSETMDVSAVGGLFDTVRKLRFSTSAYLLTHPYVQRLLAVERPGASLIPRRWFGFLRKKRFFRKILLLPADEPALKSCPGCCHPACGIQRPPLPITYGPIILPEDEPFVRDLEEEATSEYVERWRGVVVDNRARRVRVRDRSKRAVLPRVRVSRGPVSWARLWVAPVLERVKELWPELLVETDADWVDDVFGLTTTRQWVFHSFGVPAPCQLEPGWLRMRSSSSDYWQLAA